MSGVLDGIKDRLERITKRLESWDGRDPARVRATTVEAEDDFGIFNVRNYHGSYISALDAAAEQFLDTTPKLIAAVEAVEKLAAGSEEHGSNLVFAVDIRKAIGAALGEAST
ncbi:hypothetical protein [Arthrobacter sp. NicSoilC5]|uniref:hypothetical protein n=1 Tax=Arthrobacter sp. NicSoilC5 TaxID=2831000 RepID=UPI001CC7C0D4|nr:hypothetical protein [Arthrobacter sp. NicSoilC5]BCW78989.1 hypothetical protein NicSoilC5_10080 [Arthrobacter sp. NicSoilC5]